MHDESPRDEQSLQEERTLQEAIAQVLELPMFVLSMIMLVLLIVELAVPLTSEARRSVTFTVSIIWWVFVIEYAFMMFTAEDRWSYVRKHWLDGLFVLVPFFRVFAVLRAVRAIRLLRVVRPAVLGRAFFTTRRGVRQLAHVLGRHSLPYVIAVTLVVLFLGALFMLLLERGAGGALITDYGDGLWWAVGAITTVGTELYPVTAEGRVLATLLMVYGVGIFGYIAATLASYFIRPEAEEEK